MNYNVLDDRIQSDVWFLDQTDPEPFDEDSEVYINEIKSSAAIDISEIEVA